MAKTAAVAGPVLALGLWLARGSSASAWLAVPVFFVIANGFEWAVHRYLMHRPMQPRVLYVRHSLTHHPAFPGEEQEIRSLPELSIVLMPWYALLAFIILASPIAVVIGMLGGVGLAGIFAVSAVAYYCVYETFHTLYHVPESWLRARWWGRVRVVWWLRRHHHHHHQLERMAHVNFSVTFPLADLLLGTYESP